MFTVICYQPVRTRLIRIPRYFELIVLSLQPRYFEIVKNRVCT